MFQRARGMVGVRTLVPACMAAVAYIDPGNFGVNVAAGSRFGYALVWVVVAASATASVVQYLAAKLGLATGGSLAENCRDHFPAAVRMLLWVATELVVIMTDLAELVGGALALQLLFGLPLLPGALIVSVCSFAVLALHINGHSGFESVILALLGVVVCAVVWQTLMMTQHGMPVATVVPHGMSGSETLLAVGIIGATVMPHALHFHSAQSRPHPSLPVSPAVDRARLVLVRVRRSILTAMSVAGLANVALIVAAAGLPAGMGAGLPAAYDGFEQVAGQLASVLFGLALLASGLASTLVGVYTGQEVMQGFTHHRLSVWLRRGVAVLPAVALLGCGMNATQALVLSQVVLSFALPTSLIPLVLFTRRRDIMGSLVNRRSTTAFAAASTATIVALDLVLLVVTVR